MPAAGQVQRARRLAASGMWLPGTETWCGHAGACLARPWAWAACLWPCRTRWTRLCLQAAEGRGPVDSRVHMTRMRLARLGIAFRINDALAPSYFCPPPPPLHALLTPHRVAFAVSTSPHTPLTCFTRPSHLAPDCRVLRKAAL